MSRLGAAVLLCAVVPTLGATPTGASLISTYAVGLETSVLHTAPAAEPHLGGGIHLTGLILQNLLGGVAGSVGVRPSETEAGWHIRAELRGEAGYVLELGRRARMTPVLSVGAGWISDEGGTEARFLGSLGARVDLEIGPEDWIGVYPRVTLALSSTGVELYLGTSLLLDHLVHRVPQGDPEAVSSPDPSPLVAYLDLGSGIFTPDGDGVDDVLDLGLRIEGGTGVSAWWVEIRDFTGSVFHRIDGLGAPPERVSWNGLSGSGESVESARDYGVIFGAKDGYGSVARDEGVVRVGILVIPYGENLKIRISSITFSPDSADLESVEANDGILSSLVRILSAYPDHSIRIEGHANNLSWEDPDRARREQDAELVPLSRARAQSVKNALVRLGLEEERMEVKGLGGSDPLVAFADAENRWKNRRVEFVLIEK